jgi:hypothetical protein
LAPRKAEYKNPKRAKKCKVWRKCAVFLFFVFVFVKMGKGRKEGCAFGLVVVVMMELERQE